MTWQLFLIDWVVVGAVVFIIGALAHLLVDTGFRPKTGWVLCFIGVVILWPISAYGMLRSLFRFFLTMWRKHA